MSHPPLPSTSSSSSSSLIYPCQGSWGVHASASLCCHEWSRCVCKCIQQKWMHVSQRTVQTRWREFKCEWLLGGLCVCVGGYLCCCFWCFFLLFNFTLLTNPLSGLLRWSASASVHWKTSFVCIYVFLCCSVLFFWTVDTKVVLTAAILFSRYSPLTMTEWELLTKPLQWCYTRPGSNLYSGDSVLHVSHITTQSWTSSDLNSSSLCLSVYRQYLCSCLFSFHICSSFFPTLSLSIFSTSFCLSLSLSVFLVSLYLSGPFRHSNSNSGKRKILWMFNLIHEKWEYGFCTRGSYDAVRL